MARIENFRSLKTHAWYAKMVAKLKPAQVEECEKFIQENESLNKDQFCQAVVRWGIRAPELAKQKQFPFMNELVLVSGTMEGA